MLGDTSEYLSGVYPNSMLVTNTDQSEILNIVHAIKSSESKGVNDISPRIVKDVITAILDSLSSVFNKSFLLGQFPNKMKIAKIHTGI